MILKTQVGKWSNVPNSYVNNDGKPNLNRSNVDNSDDARFAVRLRGN